MRRLNSKLHLVRNTFHAKRNTDPGSAFSHGAVEKGAVSIITLAGTIDAMVATELRDLLNGHLSRKQNVIVYMADVRDFDSAGAAILLEAYVTARSNALGFVLVAVSQNARQTINLCGLNQVLPMFERLHDAVQLVRGTQEATA